MHFKQRIRKVIDDSTTTSGRIFVLTIQALIVVSLLTFSISTIPNLSPSTQKVLDTVETFTIIIFTAEYLLRLYVAERRRKFFFSFFGFIDLLSILPFYLRSNIDLRSMRTFRLLRMFRILKLVRYSKAIRRFKRTFFIAREELMLFGCVSMIILYLSAVGIYYFENAAQPEHFQSVFHSLWWALCTLTTVGYGDVYPITVGGRVFTFAVLIIGLGVVAVPAGIISSALTKAMEEEKEAKRNHGQL